MYLRTTLLPQDDDTIKIISIFYYNDCFYGINKLSRLLSKRGTYYPSYCPICLKGLKAKDLLQEHVLHCNKQTVQYPKKSIREFTTVNKEKKEAVLVNVFPIIL